MLQTELQELGFDWAIRILKHQVRIQMSFWTPWNALIYHWKLYDCTGFWSMEKLKLDEKSHFHSRSILLFPFGLEFSVEVSWLTNHKNQSRVEFCHQTNSSFKELFHVWPTPTNFFKKLEPLSERPPFLRFGWVYIE